MSEKDWVKDWANTAKRKNGRYLPKGDEPLGKAIGVRFPLWVWEWLEAESVRTGRKVSELVREKVAEAISGKAVTPVK